MKKHFYSHIIQIESIYIVLEGLELSKTEKEELILIFEDSVHATVIDVVLSHLSKEDKKTFLSHLAREKHDDIWNLLTEKVDKVEDKIRHAVDKLKDELHKDIQVVKQKK